MFDTNLKTPEPPTQLNLELISSPDKNPLVSIVVSLYNYQESILDTLNSIASQTFDSIELLVVDDASTDSSAVLAEDWLKQHQDRFLRTSLFQHQFNGGLAAARNTGFSYAKSPWVWVQDADNPLLPRAIEQCHHLTRFIQEKVALIHPLILRVPEDSSSQVFQGEGRPWQKSIFLNANSVDAMALVRKIAWEEVGGYVHIPGGWEDYDFWCNLIDFGWTGVQCPQPLCYYTNHENSMTLQKALPNVRKLERLLQNRHPWLNCVGCTTRFNDF